MRSTLAARSPITTVSIQPNSRISARHQAVLSSSTNRRFLEADLMIYVGQVVAHSWGGYTGTGAAIGLASTRSIASHHNHRVVNHPKTTTGDQRAMYFRQLKAEINAHIERQTGKRIFYINWIGGTGGTISSVFAGYSPEVEEPAWQAADEFSIVDVPQADVLVVGLPASFAYGSANNPLIAAIGMAYPPRVWLGDHVLREGGVIIGLNPSNGIYDEATYCSTREVLELYDRAAGHFADVALSTACRQSPRSISTNTASAMRTIRFIRSGCSIPVITC